MGEYRSSLGRHAAMMRDPDPQEAFLAKKRAWHEHGLAVFNPDDDFVQDGDYSNRELIRALANRLYGKARK